MEPITVMLVDNHPVFTDIAVRYLTQNGIAVVGTASEGQAALVQARALKPDVIVLDLNLPGVGGLDLIPRLRALQPEVAIVVLTLQTAPAYQTAAMTAGSDGFVTKRAVATDLLPVIRGVGEARRAKRAAKPGAQA